jgi:OOP family OmpA-OmpF porin
MLGLALLSSGADARAEPLAAASASTPPAEDTPAEDDASFYRYRPTPRSFEAGVYFGMAWFSADHNLQDLDKTVTRGHQSINNSPTIGLRVGFFPLSFLGAEVEGGVIPSHTPDTQPATIWTARGHVVAQLPMAHVVPFVYGGGGVMVLDSDALGHDADPVTYFGAGFKLAVSPYLSFRVEVRDNLLQKNRLDPTVRDGDLVHNGEILGGALFTLGRTPWTDKAASAPPDQDGDHVPDRVDQCPTESGPPPTGCPPPTDSDRDGIPNETDACPDTAGTSPSGCPGEIQPK